MKRMIQYLPLILVFIGTLLTAVGGIWLGIKSDISSKNTDKKIDSVSILSQETKRQQEIINEKQQKIEELQNKNFELSQTISQKSIDINNFQTAKDSYCYLLLIPTREDVGEFFITGKGKYPLFNININIVDLAGFNRNDKQTMETLLNNSQNIFLPSYNPNIKTPNPQIKSISSIHKSLQLNKNLGINLFITLITPNKYIYEKLKMQYVNNSWESALKVNVEGTDLQYIEISKNYPNQNPKEVFKD